MTWCVWLECGSYDLDWSEVCGAHNTNSLLNIAPRSTFSQNFTTAIKSIKWYLFSPPANAALQYHCANRICEMRGAGLFDNSAYE